MNIYIIFRGMDLLRAVENWAAPYVLVMTAILLGWAIWRAQDWAICCETRASFKPWPNSGRSSFRR